MHGPNGKAPKRWPCEDDYAGLTKGGELIRSGTLPNDVKVSCSLCGERGIGRGWGGGGSTGKALDEWDHTLGQDQCPLFPFLGRAHHKELCGHEAESINGDNKGHI